MTLDLGSGALLTAALQGASGTPGAAPGQLADGRAATGLEASLTGTVLVDRDPMFCPPGASCIGIVRRLSVIEFEDSGLWLPAPGGPGTAGAGSFGAVFADPSGLLTGALAVRDLSLSLWQVWPLQPGPGGSLVADGIHRVGVESGRVDVALSQGASSLPIPPVSIDNIGPTVLEPLSDGRTRLTISLGIGRTLSSAALGAALPVSIDLRMTGQIVAYSPASSVPEPASLAWLAVVAALASRTYKRSP